MLSEHVSYLIPVVSFPHSSSCSFLFSSLSISPRAHTAAALNTTQSLRALTHQPPSTPLQHSITLAPTSSSHPNTQLYHLNVINIDNFDNTNNIYHYHLNDLNFDNLDNSNTNNNHNHHHHD